MWIARNKDGELYAYRHKPVLTYDSTAYHVEDVLIDDYFQLEESDFPDVKYEDSPVEVKDFKDHRPVDNTHVISLLSEVNKIYAKFKETCQANIDKSSPNTDILDDCTSYNMGVSAGGCEVFTYIYGAIAKELSDIMKIQNKNNE